MRSAIDAVCECDRQDRQTDGRTDETVSDCYESDKKDFRGYIFAAAYSIYLAANFSKGDHTV